MKSIFISYSRTNLDEVKKLADMLAMTGHSVWYDQVLTGGQRWWDNILEKVREYNVFLSVLTPDTLNSQACNDELKYADALGKPILPLLFSPEVNLKSLPKSIAERQVVDYCNEQADMRFARLLNALSKMPDCPLLPDPLPVSPPTPLSYLIDLREQVNMPGSLDQDSQIVLSFKLKKAIKNKVGEELAELVQIMESFLKRSDLYADVANDISAILVPFSRTKPSNSNSFSSSVESQNIVSDAVESNKAEAHKPTISKEVIKVPSHVVVKNKKEEQPKASANLSAELPAQDAEILLVYNLRRVIESQEKWQIKVDENNHLLIALTNSLVNSVTVPDCVKQPRGGIAAVLVVRDSLFEEKSKSLKKIDWEISDDAWLKTIVSGGALYLTGGLAAFGLLSKSVRDELMTVTATKTWKRPNTDMELGVIAHELVGALKIISPDAKSYTATKLDD